MIDRIGKIYLILFVTGIFALNSCSSTTDNIYLVQGKLSTAVERSTIQDFKKDLEKVVNTQIVILTEPDKLPKEGLVFLLGTIDSNNEIESLAKKSKIKLTSNFPGSRGGIWEKTSINNRQNAIVIAGSDVQGFQYALYDYAHEVLGIDPFEYWTGQTPDRNPNIDLFSFENRQILPPQIPILCYFENDVDELANYRGKLLEYDWKSYTEMINSLVRIRYNAIQLFDMLGRPEFFLREAYQKIHPDYDVDIQYIEKMIDYAHSKGMKVQIDMSLGYKIYQLDEDQASCWKDNKDKWIEAWSYYFEKTPVGKCDIFSLRPRNQVWDWEYKSTCGEDKTDVFNEVYEVFGELVDKYKPDAIKVLICYHDGMQMFNERFNPPSDFIVVWCDNGWGDFEYQPKSTKGYHFGTYMHAGFWRNHTVSDPYPELIDKNMTEFISKYNADKYLQVNGQTFRLFILNIEAFSRLAYAANNFDGEAFYMEWASQYFGKDAAQYVVSAYKNLHQAQLNEDGYVEVLYNIKVLQEHLKGNDLSEQSKSFKRGFKADLQERIVLLDDALKFAEKGKKLENSKAHFYHDHVELPLLLLHQLLNYQKELQDIALVRDSYLKTGDVKYKLEMEQKIEHAKLLLKQHIDTRIAGDNNPKWKNWYNPQFRRPNNGFPQMSDLVEIANNID